MLQIIKSKQKQALQGSIIIDLWLFVTFSNETKCQSEVKAPFIFSVLDKKRNKNNEFPHVRVQIVWISL